MRLRSGSTLWAVDPDAAVSRRLEGRERDLTLVQLEMRRALFLWPHGFEWKRTGTRAEAPLAGLGTLTVTFADAHAKRPSSLAFTGIDGAAGDEYRAITWRDEKDKAWPVRLELWHDKARVWTETVVAVETGARYIDSFFVPPDTRDTAGAKPRDIATVRPTDLPEHRSKRMALPKGTDWDAARAQHARLAAEHGPALEKQGLKLDVNATFEVSDALQPVAVLLRLAPGNMTVDPATAKAWPVTPERPGLSTFVVGLPSLSPARLADLRAQAPPDAVCGTPYVRFDPAHPDQYVMVLVPLSPKTAREDR